MFSKMTRTVLAVFVAITILVACAPSAPSKPVILPATAMPAPNGFQDKPAIPNDSGIEGVQTFPDKAVYHNHVQTLNVPVGDMPPVFGALFQHGKTLASMINRLNWVLLYIPWNMARCG